MAKAYVKHDYAVTGRDYVETEGGDTPAGGGINYSTDEQDTGLTWINGSHVYQKTISMGTLPNNSTITIPHGISGLNVIIHMYGSANSSQSGYTIPLEDLDAQAGINSAIRLYANNTNLYITTKADQSTYDTCYVTMCYTKTE